MKRRTWIIALVVLGAIGWYLFRPELLFVNKKVNEEQVAAAGASTMAALFTGRFHSVAHETHGAATIQELGNGRRVLRLTDFATSNGPDVRVYLVAASDATDNETVTKAGFVELGALKGNEGDQNYEIPSAVDLEKYRAVTIWCHRFNVNFATAPLAPAS
jgi:Electron transfer DM13